MSNLAGGLSFRAQASIRIVSLIIYKTPLGLRNPLSTLVEVPDESGGAKSKIRTNELPGLAVSDQRVVE